MHALALIIITSIGYIIAYNTYGKYLAKHIFKLNPKAPVPSRTLADGKDFVVSKKHVMFGHHFTSIAGTGPIVGPAIGIIWGWVPAILWVFFGSIFMGAVHDFASLIISIRHEGKSIADITAHYINPRVRLIFFLVVFLALLIVIAIFGLIIALIFAKFPQSVWPVWLEIPIAIAMGWFAFKKNYNLVLMTCIFVAIMYVSILLGAYFPLALSEYFGIPATGLWTIILLIYAFIASVLPVSTLLQPRDYLNAWQLYIAIGMLVIGIITTSLSQPLFITAPALNLSPEGAPPIFPFLFITIACGAISGFHCLVASGTSSKQIASENDAQLVGYGSMLVEAALATLIIIAVTAGIGMAYTTASGETLTGLTAWQTHYGSWTASQGLGSKLDAVVIGSSNLIKILGIPPFIGIAIMGVFIASFAGTTLDSATRVQRYIVTELFSKTRFTWLQNKYGATGFAVGTAAILAFSSGATGKGALMLWPLFGAINQLLAALALMIATIYLRKKSGHGYLVAAIPCLIMVVITFWATSSNQLLFIKSNNPLLFILNGLILGLAFMMAIECLMVFIKKPKASEKIQQINKTESPLNEMKGNN